MDKNDKREFANILRATLDVYGKEASQDVMRLWWHALEPYSIAEVSAGFTKHIRSTESGGFAPKPADIIRMIEGSTSDRGMIAWEKVREAIVRAGGYRSVAFDDPIIHVVVEGMGGWSELCSTNKDEMPFRSAEFAKRYRARAEIGINGHPAYLVGRSEASNGMHGFESEPPMLIGDTAKASEVMRLGSSKPLLVMQIAKCLPNSLQSKDIGVE